MSSLPILVLNSGSSSIKFAIYEAGGAEPLRLYEGAVDGIGTEQGKFWIKDSSGNKLVDQSPALPNRSVAFKLVADLLHSGDFPRPSAIGHRMVCGAPTLQINQRVTPEMIDEMERYKDFAPLHTPIGAYIMRQALELFPGVRRIGFHGISYESIIHQLLPNVPARLIVAHLGNGASISAVREGKCVDTSMGLTPTGGIISGTRTGDIDPGVLLFMLRKIATRAKSVEEAADILEAAVSKKAGLLGMSELSNDMRDLRSAINAGNKKARLAVDKFARAVASWAGSFFAELGGLDMLVFTGGIGENDIAVRAEICAGLSSLGIVLDSERNNVRGAAVISAENSPVTVRVIPPAEDLIIVNHVVRLLSEQEEELAGAFAVSQQG